MSLPYLSVSPFLYAQLTYLKQVSMVGAHMLRLVDLRLRNIFNSNKPWAGKHVILVGDLFQVGLA